jgi:hypothetical protein
MLGETLLLSIDTVWEAIPELEWATPERIREASGVDKQRVNAILNFLIHWKFVDESKDPKFSVRRRAGIMPPTAAFAALRTFIDAEKSLETSPRQASFAERVACRACGERSFNFLEQNLVECRRCHERQWFTIEIGITSGIQEQVANVSPASWLRRLLGR